MEGYEIRYVSASGDVLNLSEYPYDANGTELPSWSYDALTVGFGIAGMTRGNPEYGMVVTIAARSDEDGLEARNRLYEVPAKDVASLTPGRLYMGDWYISGYVKAAAPGNFWQTREVSEHELSFIATDQKWTRETTRNFIDESGSGSTWLDFPYDFPFDYGYSRMSTSIENENAYDSPIMLRVYGPAVNPHVTIGGNTYQVNVTLAAGEILELDGVSHTAMAYGTYGGGRNVFSKIVGDFAYGSGSFAFQPIKPGANEVSWPGGFDFDIVVYEQRDEPRWS